MLCVHCSTPVPDAAKFCHSCGSLVSDAEGQAEASASMDSSAFRKLERLLRADTEGEFEIERPIGKGGMAVVYLATEIRLARKVAIKVLPPDLIFGHGIERFLREARTAAALVHPSIIPIYRIASGEELFWYAMQYVDGQGLDQVLKERGRLSLEETIEILSPVADALEYAHEHHVIHRDIKPANVMLDPSGRVIVTDFGIAKALTEGTLTASGSVVGTPYYMSPEQGMGKLVTGAADQYSVAVMAYRMLSGQVPFEGDSAIDILHKHCIVLPPPLEALCPSLPPHVFKAVHKALEKDPAHRLSSVTAFVDALKGPTQETDDYDLSSISPTLEVTPGGTLGSRISTKIIQTPTRDEPKRRWWPLVAAAAVVGGVGIGFVALRGGEPTAQPPPARTGPPGITIDSGTTAAGAAQPLEQLAAAEGTEDTEQLPPPTTPSEPDDPVQARDGVRIPPETRQTPPAAILQPPAVPDSATLTLILGGVFTVEIDQENLGRQRRRFEVKLLAGSHLIRLLRGSEVVFDSVITLGAGEAHELDTRGNR